MVITKNSEVAKIFSEIVKDVLTPRVIGGVSYVSLIEGKGYAVKFENSDMRELYIKDNTVDITVSVNSMFINAVLASLATADSVEVSKTDDNVIVGKWKVKKASESLSFRERNVERATITFTPAQYAKLEKDFELTVANYFSSQKNVDTIGFVNDEGAVKLIATGASLYKVAHTFDATIDDVFAEQTLGHSTRIYLIPHRVYNLTKYFNDNLKVYLSDERNVYFESDTVCMTYSTIDFGLNQYKINRDAAVDFEGVNVADFKDVIAEYITPLLENKFAGLEDQNIEIKSSDGTMKVSIDKYISASVESNANINISSNAEVLSYICKNHPNAKIKEFSETYMVAKDENDYLIFSNNKY